ncbi:MAG: ExbD/TolR family protein, partial [Akkermansiaceae bacterium]
MARKKTSDTFEEDEPGLDISSLIDVCFLLLIYFLVTTTIQPREQDLKMTLPAAAPSDTPPPIEPLFIKVDKSGQIYVNTGAAQEALDGDVANRDLPQLKERLDQYAAGAKVSELCRKHGMSDATL